MRYLKVLALLSILLVPAVVSHAQIAVGVGVAPYAYGPAYGYGPPACSYGYYDYAPYACAPYGYYGPEWYSGGIFIGAGPWFRRGFGFREGFRGGYAYGRREGFARPGFAGRGGFAPGRGGNGFAARGFVGGGARGGFSGGARGGFSGGGGGFRGGGGSGGRGGGGHR
jgi:hypothetical protein